MSAIINHAWKLQSRPQTLFTEDNFAWSEEPLPELGPQEILVRNIYLSLDPTNRGWVRNEPSYLPPVGIGEVMRGVTIGEVMQSNDAQIKVGDIVQGMLGWQEYAITSAEHLTRLQVSPQIPLHAYFGLFSHIGLTAYYGLLDILQPQAGETLVVTAAAGAVGSLVGQIGKIHGCRVVGICGSDDKCDWLVNELGFDAAINYKSQDVGVMLTKNCVGGIDIAFENVGGKIFDDVLKRMKNFGRISLCGLISQYNNNEIPPGPYQFSSVITKRLKVQGFIVLDYMQKALPAFQALGQWYQQGKLKYRVDEVQGLEHAVTAVNKLFTGGNKGKLIVKIADNH